MRGERAELSKKNPYYISKHRYYELKHFCRQYDEWKRALVRIDGWKAFPESTGAIVNATPSNPTEQMAMARAFYSSRVDLLEHCLGELEPAIAPYVLRGVTEGHSYEALRIKGCLPKFERRLLFMNYRVKTNFDRGYVNAMDKVRVFIESNQKVMFVNTDEYKDAKNARAAYVNAITLIRAGGIVRATRSRNDLFLIRNDI